MSIKEDWYVRSINGICYVVFSQSFKVRYSMAIQILRN